MNPYKELGVSTNADFPEVRKRFMELSRILHTDKGGSRTTAAMQLLSQAKTILLDPVARTIFDLDQSIVLESTDSDSELEDAGKEDAGKGDAGKEDAGKEDTGTEDTGTEYAGKEDAGKDGTGTKKRKRRNRPKRIIIQLEVSIW